MHIEIQFNNDVPEPYEAFVILRDNEMVIDMPATDEYPKYLIDGWLTNDNWPSAHDSNER